MAPACCSWRWLSVQPGCLFWRGNQRRGRPHGNARAVSVARREPAVLVTHLRCDAPGCPCDTPPQRGGGRGAASHTPQPAASGMSWLSWLHSASHTVWRAYVLLSPALAAAPWACTLQRRVWCARSGLPQSVFTVSSGEPWDHRGQPTLAFSVGCRFGVYWRRHAFRATRWPCVLFAVLGSTHTAALQLLAAA